MSQGCGYNRKVTPVKCVVEDCNHNAEGYSKASGHMCRKHWAEYWQKADADTGGY